MTTTNSNNATTQDAPFMDISITHRPTEDGPVFMVVIQTDGGCVYLPCISELHATTLLFSIHAALKK